MGECGWKGVNWLVESSPKGQIGKCGGKSIHHLSLFGRAKREEFGEDG